MKVIPIGESDAELPFSPLPLLLSSAGSAAPGGIAAVRADFDRGPACPVSHAASCPTLFLAVFSSAAFESAIPMPLYVIEISGEPIVVFPEGSLELAQKEARSGNVTEALQEFTRDGTPLWDGEASLEVREAGDDEAAHYQAGFNEALADGDISEDEQDEFAVFLIETDDAE